jgi:RHS repeat-associated protein
MKRHLYFIVLSLLFGCNILSAETISLYGEKYYLLYEGKSLDKDNNLEEYIEPTENLTTWVYEEGSLVPTAKLCEGKSYSIVSDYLGRPAQAYDDKGELVWQVEFDIYGRIREDTFNNQPFIPFRQLGQYEDVETGLYYNRLRYYNPESGLYISQDPIRLAGNNPNFYAYVSDSNVQIDSFGLSTSPILGFKSYGQLNQFGSQIQATLARGGFKNSEVFMQGSSVTGRSFKTGIPFDVGRISDFDVAIVNSDLLKKVQSLDLGKPGRPYSMPLNSDAMKELGFGDLADSLSNRFGRDVNFRIYDSESAVRANGKSYKIKCKS